MTKNNLEYSGVVDKVFNGYGFIRIKESVPLIFFHYSAIQNGVWQDIEVGTSVIINEVADEPRGTLAKKVTIEK